MPNLKSLELLNSLRNGLIVSCQALENEPLHFPAFMSRMALAAMEGGAVGIRANGPSDISSIKETVNLPLVGLYKKVYPNSEVYITPTFSEVSLCVKAGAEIIAIDATLRTRPDLVSLEELIFKCKSEYPNHLFMADISTFEEGVNAEKIGFDIVSTTLSGYTSYSQKSKSPDFDLVDQLANTISVPIFAEGRIKTPQQALEFINLGAWSVVVGGAITRPQLITKDYVDVILESKRQSCAI